MSATAKARCLYSHDLSSVTIARLRTLGIRIVGVQMVPTETGSWINATKAYVIDDNGTGKVKTFLELLDVACRSVA